jgi:regulator of protease activity HflC (stomatin/prohibitin superfamily)
MAWFVFACIFGVLGLVAFAAMTVTEKKAVAGSVGVILLLIGFGFFAISGLKSVPVKNIGVPQSFGSVGSQVYEPGTHQTWNPWLHLTDIDETVQTTTFKDSGNDDGTSCNGGLQVRIGGQQTACADITIQWQVLPAAAGSLFSDYANKGDLMNTIESAVVLRSFESVVNSTLSSYNPITDVQGEQGSVTGATSQPSQFTSFSPTILTAMQDDIGTRIKVIAVIMPQLHYSTSIEDKLAAIQQAYADFAVAQENVKVNQQKALALAALNSHGVPSLNQLIAQCLTEAQTNHNLQCIPGATSNINLVQPK